LRNEKVRLGVFFSLSKHFIVEKVECTSCARFLWFHMFIVASIGVEHSRTPLGLSIGVPAAAYLPSNKATIRRKQRELFLRGSMARL
jgi:hypothetical protein